MEPAFFGGKDNPLFGIYHPPLLGITGESAVLICYPLFQEYIRSHRALRKLAEQLAKAGSHVLRFDYLGTGDSAGDFDNLKLSQWQESIHLAENELRELSGVRKISIIGLRFGAMLAAMHDSSNVRKLILWDPIINGREYIDALKSMHKAILVDPVRFPMPRNNSVNNLFTELMGFGVPTTLCQQIQRCNILDYLSSKIEKYILIVSEDNGSYREFKDKFLSSGREFEYFVVPGAGGWEDIDKIEDMLMPNEIINFITSVS